MTNKLSDCGTYIGVVENENNWKKRKNKVSNREKLFED